MFRRHLLPRSWVAALVIVPIAVLTAFVTWDYAKAESPPRHGEHPAAPVTRFQEPSHQHHPPGSILGDQTPHLIPTEMAVGLFLRMFDSLSHDAQQSKLAHYFDRIEKVTNAQFSADDRERIVVASRA